MYVINRNFVKVISKEYKLYNNCRGVLVGRILMRSHSSQLEGLQKDRRSAGGEAKVPLGSAPEAELGRRPLANSGILQQPMSPVKWLDCETGAIVGPSGPQGSQPCRML